MDSILKNPRIYGKKPFCVAAVHGGPGAPGEMAPVARELSSVLGILEPLQTAKTLEGQIEELKEILEKNGEFPLVLIGWSWGAWLSYLLAARFPGLVKKLVLVGSGPFEEKYARNILEVRLERMGLEGAAEAQFLMEKLNDPSVLDKDTPLARLGELISRADAYDPLPAKYEAVSAQFDVYQSVWEMASEMRRSGRLLEIGRKIRCPVVAVHGDFDPHPAEGVCIPLSAVLKDFRFILLQRCGHKPWIEKHARDTFYKTIKKEIG
jgi:pimeloyl-ACP methyl ester carboxylesterase